jgi:hypothetical protein
MGNKKLRSEEKEKKEKKRKGGSGKWDEIWGQAKICPKLNSFKFSSCHLFHSVLFRVMENSITWQLEWKRLA